MSRVLTKAALLKLLLDKQKDLSGDDAARLIELFFEKISAALIRGEDVQLTGFGNFTILNKSARPGRNPKTGEAVTVSARRVVTYRPSIKLKAKIKGGRKKNS